MIAVIHAADESRSIDPGRRIVHVEQKGHKWVRVRQIGAALCSRIRRSTYDDIVVAEYHDEDHLKEAAL